MAGIINAQSWFSPRQTGAIFIVRLPRITPRKTGQTVAPQCVPVTVSRFSPNWHKT
jgi:hypothetical protein